MWEERILQGRCVFGCVLGGRLKCWSKVQAKCHYPELILQKWVTDAIPFTLTTDVASSSLQHFYGSVPPSPLLPPTGPLEGKALQKWVTDAIPSTFTTEVTSSSFQYFATMPPPGSESQRATVAANEPLIRLLLFTNKDEVPGVYKALATNMRSTRFGFGWVQSSLKQNAELMTQFSVSKASV